jgi:BirA family biotin operon repressor/biotin-[acetyl-CoA-carboxylase] ligase
MPATATPWRTARIATRVWRFDTIDSTQSEAKRLIAQGQGDGALVLAGSQTAGRGRMSRAWHSPPGNIYLSLVLQPSLPLRDWGALTLLSALALVETLDTFGIGGAALKWPNDVLIRGRKVAGMLAEIEADRLVLGVGVNLNASLPANLPRATSVRAATGIALPPDEFLRRFIETLEAHLVAAEGGARFGQQWTARTETLGHRVQIGGSANATEGLAESVADDGALLVRRADGTLTACYGGEVADAASAAAESRGGST